jgi:hypothetical protein
VELLHFPHSLPRPLLPVVKMLPPKALSAKLATDYESGYVIGELFTDPPDPYKMAARPTPGVTVFPFIAKVQDDIPFYWLKGGLWTVLVHTNCFLH